MPFVLHDSGLAPCGSAACLWNKSLPTHLLQSSTGVQRYLLLKNWVLPSTGTIQGSRKSLSPSDLYFPHALPLSLVPSALCPLSERLCEAGKVPQESIGSKHNLLLTHSCGAHTALTLVLGKRSWLAGEWCFVTMNDPEH